MNRTAVTIVAIAMIYSLVALVITNDKEPPPTAFEICLDEINSQYIGPPTLVEINTCVTNKQNE